MPQIFSRTADTWFLAIAHGAFVVALAPLTLVTRLVEQAVLVLSGMPWIGWPVTPLVAAASLTMFGTGWVGTLSVRGREDLWGEPEWIEKARRI